MKKVLSFILCFMLCAGAVMLAACKKEEVYNLDNLYTDYLSIADKCDHIVVDGDGLKFSYASNGQDYFAAAANYEPYCHINDYNTLLYNILDFVAANIKRCSTDGIEVDASTKNALKLKLNNLTEKFEVLEVQISSMSAMLQSIQSNPENLQKGVYLNALKFMLNSYNDVFIKAYDFSFALSRVYFAYAVTGSNPKFIGEEFTKVEALKVMSLLNSRLLLQRANESYKYIVTNLLTSNFLNNITTGECGQMPNFNNYTNAISNITAADFVPTELAERLTDEQLTKFKPIATELYNIQACQDNDFYKYNQANQDIDYASVKLNVNASAYEKLCLGIMDDYFALCDSNAAALTKLLDVLQIRSNAQ